jgi:DNA mismatch repair protein MutS2
VDIHILICLFHTLLFHLDELGSGTDPNQGVAIAQALLEALLETGSRVAITTHYMALKQLASSDDRFSVGGMQFVRGRPTYKLLPGVVGESFALSVAERLNIPQKVINRATELLDSETRQMGDLIKDMEDQKALIDEQADELTNKRKELEELEQKMKKQQEKLERELINARRNEANKFAKKLEEKEKVLEEILGKLKSDPSKKLVAKSWDEIKYVKRDAMTEAENIPSVLRRKEKAATQAAQQLSELVPLDELRVKPEIHAGDTLIVCKKGALNGSMATIVNVSGKRVDVTVRGMPMTLKLGEVAMPTKSFKTTMDNNTNNVRAGPQMSKMARKALADEELDEIHRRSPDQGQVTNKSDGSVMRLSSNTVDCLGKFMTDLH